MRHGSNGPALVCRQCGQTGEAWGPYYSTALGYDLGMGFVLVTPALDALCVPMLCHFCEIRRLLRAAASEAPPSQIQPGRRPRGGTE